MDPIWAIQEGFWLEILERPRMGESEGFIVGKREGEALGEVDGDVIRRSKRGCHLVKRTGPGLVNVWIGCWVGSVAGQMLRGTKTKVVRSYALRHLH